MSAAHWKQFASFAVMGALLCGCTAVDRLENIGAGPPQLAPIANPRSQGSGSCGTFVPTAVVEFAVAAQRAQFFP